MDTAGNKIEDGHTKTDKDTSHILEILEQFLKKNHFSPKNTHAWRVITKVVYSLKVGQQNMFRPSQMNVGTIAAEKSKYFQQRILGPEITHA